MDWADESGRSGPDRSDRPCVCVWAREQLRRLISPHALLVPPLSPGLDAARTCFRTGSLRPGADRGGDQQAEGGEVERDGDGQTRNFEHKLRGVGSRLGKGFSDQGSEAINDANML